MRWLGLLVVLVGCNQLYGLDETVGPPPLDSDNDKITDEDDNCVLVPNVDQANADDDTFGDACDPCPMGTQSGIDVDADGIDDSCDACALGPNHDEDGDGLYDACDNCPGDANHSEKDDQRDEDSDGVGDACDPTNKLPNQRLFFDGFGPPDSKWNTGFAEWAATADTFGPIEIPLMGDGPWNRRGKVSGRAWQVVAVIDLPMTPPNNTRIGLTTVQPATTGPAPTCELYYAQVDQQWHQAGDDVVVSVTNPFRITLQTTPSSVTNGPNMDVTCVFGGQRVVFTGFFDAEFFPSLLLRNGIAQFRYIDVVQ
jgi:hypothetical protein